MPRTSEPGRTVGSRLLEVLFAFQPGHSALSLADLVRKTGMPHATVRRLAVELTGFGALDRRPDGRFTVGLRLWQLGTLAPLTESLRTLAQPFLEDLCTALHQHVQLAVLEGQEAVIIERLSAPEAPELVSQVGGRLPLHCTGVGKVPLSHGGTELIETVLSGELREYSSRSIVAPEVLRKEIADCRRTGTATVRGELTPGTDSVATRIVDGEGGLAEHRQRQDGKRCPSAGQQEEDRGPGGNGVGT
ncbi:IclR family transcriptional regulator [Streptomyces flaveus]|uniref:IclR family transcriptional regulator n=1 Tax=Streptomyces flaveus TaxID=66370 RepID=UPI00332961AC